LWEFDTKAKTWTWEGGSSVGGLSAIAIYGTEGTAAPGNVPGERHDAVSCADKSGNLWLFGGLGKDSSGAWGNLNDLWNFNPTTREWTWVSGASTVPYHPSSGPAGEFGQLGVYGTQGIPAASNVPGGRDAAVCWTDSSGNFWLFGGYGFDSTGMYGFLNDLWEFNPTTSEWTWVSGSSTMPLDPSTGEIRQQGVYGTQGIPAASNVPGGRDAAVGWTDGSGNLWLFGGRFASTSFKAIYALNDLWEFDPAAKTWTWMSGADAENAVGVYGTQRVAAAANVPGARYSAVSWTDSSSNLWLFGGRSYDTVLAEGILFNDVWKFDATTKMWTWMSGADTPNALGVYGTQGVAAPTNMPGARWHAVGWTDSNGDFWLFGGGGSMEFNDLWRYQP
jgi:N-acetylneuraminic acid mutarotase